MRILICSANYFPELTGIGKYSGEMGAWLAMRGHQVRAVTAPPYYPEWKVKAGYSAFRYKWEKIAGVEVCRCPTWVPARPSGLKRLFHLASFALSSFFVIMRQVFWRPHIILTIEPPLVCAPAAIVAARLSGARAWLHVQDFEVDAAFDLGILPSGLIRSWVLGVEKWLMLAFDIVSTISPRMVDKLHLKGAPAARTMLFPNWVDIGGIFPLNRPSAFRKDLGIDEDKVVALYSGNMGEKQGLEIVLEVASQAANEKKILFVLCGDGAAKPRLQREFPGLPNVVWLPLQPEGRLNELLNAADVHLLPQREDVADLVMPSKLTGMLASGRPVVATAAPGTQVAQVVCRCGVVTRPGNVQEMLAALRRLADNRAEREYLGRMARQYAEENLSHVAILGRFEKELHTLARQA